MRTVEYHDSPLFLHMNDAPDFSLALKGASYEATLVLFPIASIPSSPLCDQVYFSTDTYALFEGVKNSTDPPLKRIFENE